MAEQDEIARKEAGDKLVAALHACALTSDGGIKKYLGLVLQLAPVVYRLAHAGVTAEHIQSRMDEWFKQDFGGGG